MSDKSPKTSIVKLDGTLIKEDGTTKKSNFFKFLQLQPDDYSDIAFTAEEAQSIRTHLQHLSTGASAAIPIKCAGAARCPFAFTCPLVKLDKERKKENPQAKSILPIARSCVIESNLLLEWTRLYIQEYEIDEQNFTEFMLVRELAEIELMLWRLNNNISKPENAELVQEVVVGVDKQGNPLTRQEMSAFLEAKERLQNRKSRLVKLMVGDRQEKYKREAALKMKSEDDPSTNSAKLRGQIDRLLKQAKTLDVKIKETEGKIIDIDTDSNLPKEPETKPLTPEDLIDGEE